MNLRITLFWLCSSGSKSLVPFFFKPKLQSFMDHVLRWSHISLVGKNSSFPADPLLPISSNESSLPPTTHHTTVIFWLVVLTPLKNISQLGILFPIYGKIKNVPNHQPVVDHWAMFLLGTQRILQMGRHAVLLHTEEPIKKMQDHAPAVLKRGAQRDLRLWRSGSSDLAAFLMAKSWETNGILDKPKQWQIGSSRFFQAIRVSLRVTRTLSWHWEWMGHTWLVKAHPWSNPQEMGGFALSDLRWDPSGWRMFDQILGSNGKVQLWPQGVEDQVHFIDHTWSTIRADRGIFA